MAGTVPRGVVHLEAEAAMGLDSVVTLALGTRGTAERRLRPGPRLGRVPTVGSCGPKAPGVQGCAPTKAPGSPGDSEGQRQGFLGPWGQAREQRADGR